MKYLTDRQEIAMAMNFGQNPVLTINMEDRQYEGSDFALGCKFRVAWDDSRSQFKDMSSRCNLCVENGELFAFGHGACIHSDFGRSDVLEMAEWAQAPLIHKGQQVIVIQDYPSRRKCLVRVMKASDRMDTHCVQVLSFRDIEDDEFQIERYPM